MLTFKNVLQQFSVVLNAFALGVRPPVCSGGEDCEPTSFCVNRNVQSFALDEMTCLVPLLAVLCMFQAVLYVSVSTVSVGDRRIVGATVFVALLSAAVLRMLMCHAAALPHLSS